MTTETKPNLKEGPQILTEHERTYALGMREVYQVSEHDRVGTVLEVRNALGSMLADMAKFADRNPQDVLDPRALTVEVKYDGAGRLIVAASVAVTVGSTSGTEAATTAHTSPQR